MHILRIEHPVPDYDTWKAAFNSDPIGRKRSGVLRFTIQRPIDDPLYVAVDLEFATPKEAESMLVSLRQLWGRVEGKVMTAPRARIFEVVTSASP